jgi:hypothetical protein
VSNHVLLVTTEKQRDLLHRGRRAGGMCGACGRTFGSDETVYWEVILIDIMQTAEGRPSGYRTTLEAPVGRECVSSDFLAEMEGRQPERCAECGRGVFYRVSRVRRHRVACSWICRDRAGAAERATRTEGTR